LTAERSKIAAPSPRQPPQQAAVGIDTNPVVESRLRVRSNLCRLGLPKPRRIGSNSLARVTPQIGGRGPRVDHESLA
jgi:hypothetical protein